MSLNNFKSFVKEHPSLVNYVRNNEMTWQGFYELFDLYGPTNHVWDKYLGITSTTNGVLKDFFSLFRNIDMNELQRGIGSLQKGIGYVQDFLKERASDTSKVEKERSSYEPRPLYKYFDD